MSKQKSEQFEKSLAELNQLITKMEQGDLTLDESLKEFEKGIKLSKDCQTALEKAEQQVELLMKDNNDA